MKLPAKHSQCHYQRDCIGRVRPCIHDSAWKMNHFRHFSKPIKWASCYWSTQCVTLFSASVEKSLDDACHSLSGYTIQYAIITLPFLGILNTSV